MARGGRRCFLLAALVVLWWPSALEHRALWSSDADVEAFAAPKKQQASLFEAATSAQKSKGRGSSKKSSKKKVSKGVKKEVKPFPDKAGDSFLPAQGACVAGAFLPVQYPTEHLDLEQILFSPDSVFKVGLGITVVGFLLGLVSIVSVTMAMEEGRLATTGPFGVVRSPTYTGFLIMCAGACVMAGLSIPRAVFTLALGGVLAMKLAEEEEALKQARPEAWEKYSKKVPYKLLPFLW
ncbi:unnamed protein product [Durusdinium trenchii]|uniref:Delta(14)-sterol reductase TM7SF2 (Delta-14-SR) (3-beta-hydroxysterol Delta (14)-reductase) (C-14 sterol reductase) (C14SR) (Sterol C14-reductase) (Transmembrane 7 superfamily member 2) n=2 Tax=Durusdinium trenchii TaxID=1381693 RepID=A0ABP0MPP5_9DINO